MEGKKANAEEQKREQRIQQRGGDTPGGVSETRREIERQRDKNDKAFVEELANS